MFTIQETSFIIGGWGRLHSILFGHLPNFGVQQKCSRWVWSTIIKKAWLRVSGIRVFSHCNWLGIHVNLRQEPLMVRRSWWNPTCLHHSIPYLIIASWFFVGEGEHKPLVGLPLSCQNWYSLAAACFHLARFDSSRPDDYAQTSLTRQGRAYGF